MIENKSFKSIIVYTLAFLVGTNFAMVPALSSVFTDPHLFDLSQTRLGNLFIPQVLSIIISSLLTPFIVNRWGQKRTLGLGILLILLSMITLCLSYFILFDRTIIFNILMIITGILGFGFGMSLTTLNPIVAHLHSDRESSAILIMQFLVVIGTASPPLLISYISIDQWVILPLITLVSLSILFVFFIISRFDKEAFFHLPNKINIPTKLWIFFIVIVIYGLFEGAFGSFGSVLLREQGLSISEASLGLSLFWFSMGLNRLLFGLISNRVRMTKFFLSLPLLVGITLFFLPMVNSTVITLFLFSLCGFFMGSIFPGAIGWGTIEFGSYSVIVSGLLMAADQIGTGISTNVIGYIDRTISITIIMRVLSIITILIFLLFIYLSKNSKIEEAFGGNKIK